MGDHEGWVKVEHADGAYYEHTVSGETQWDKPAGFVAVHHAGEGDWVEMHDPSSQSFYYENTVTGETSWDKPAKYEAHALAVAAGSAAPPAAAAAAPAAAAAAPAPAKLTAREKHQLKLLKKDEARLQEELAKVEQAEACPDVCRKCVSRQLLSSPPAAPPPPTHTHTTHRC